MYLKEFRERLNLTQNEISLKLDIAQTTIARYENNKIKPTSTIIFKYINELNANPNFLFLGLEPITLNKEEEYLSQQNNEIIKDLSLSIIFLEILFFILRSIKTDFTFWCFF